MSTRSAPTLSIRLLGPFEVRVADAVVDAGRWERRKTRHLVKLLALQPHRSLHKEEVRDLLWPELDPDEAGAALRRVLHDARRGFEPRLRRGEPSRFVRSDGDRVRLEAPGGVAVDVDEFERRASAALAANDPAACEAALALYRGELLPDDPYEDWCGARREFVRARWADLVRTAARVSEAGGDLARAGEWHERALANDATDEWAHRALMRLRARAGDREGVARQFARCRDAVRRELDCEPEPETRSLYEQLVRDTAGTPDVSPALESVPSPVGNDVVVRPGLPRGASSFVGRARELAETDRALDAARVVTLTGIGGTGKTRLAVEVAARRGTRVPVWFVDLAPLSDPALVAGTAASAVGVAERAGDRPEDALCAELGDRDGLVVLDNCEHVVDACARLCALLLDRCERVRILATSREPLGLDGEAVLAVPTLECPRAGEPIGSIRERAAVRLFEDRARLANAKWSLTDANAADVATLCRELDGLPLAIELAAAHARSLTVGEIVARLGERFRLLKSRGRLADERHRTLRASMDWSYALLLESDRLALRRFAVFSGGWTLSAAEAVCSGVGLDPEAILAHVERLADRSLVLAEERDGTTRYGMLETVRLYALDKLARTGEEGALRSRHFAWCLELAHRPTREPDGANELVWLRRFDAEVDNLRSALGWAVEDRGAPTDGLRLAARLALYWELRGRDDEGSRWLDAALAGAAADAPLALRAQALKWSGHYAAKRGEVERARGLFEASLVAFRDTDDRVGLAGAVREAAFLARDEGDLDRAEALATEVLAAAREIGDLKIRTSTSTMLGLVAMDRADYGAARTHFDDALDAARERASALDVAVSLHNLGEVALREHRLADAERALDECLSTARAARAEALVAYTECVLAQVATAAGDLPRAAALLESALGALADAGDVLGVAYALEATAGCAGALGDWDGAVRVAGAAEAARAADGKPRSADEAVAVERVLAGAREAIGSERVRVAYETARATEPARVADVGLELLRVRRASRGDESIRPNSLG